SSGMQPQNDGGAIFESTTDSTPTEGTPYTIPLPPAPYDDVALESDLDSDYYDSSEDDFGVESYIDVSEYWEDSDWCNSETHDSASDSEDELPPLMNLEVESD